MTCQWMRNKRRSGRRVKGASDDAVVVLRHAPAGAEGTSVNAAVAGGHNPTGAERATVNVVVAGGRRSMDAEDAAVNGGVAEGWGQRQTLRTQPSTEVRRQTTSQLALRMAKTAVAEGRWLTCAGVASLVDVWTCELSVLSGLRRCYSGRLAELKAAQGHSH
jgi:hypothetical protein